MFVDLLLNLAAGLTQTLFENGAQELAKALADPQRDALKACYTRAFEAALADVAHTMRAETGEESEADLLLVRDVLKEMVAHPPAYAQMLRLAVERNGLKLPYWDGRYRAVNGPERLRNVPFDLRRTLTALHNALTQALDEAARDAESPLFNWWTVYAVRALQDEQRVTAALLQKNLDLTSDLAARNELDAYLHRAVTALEARIQRLVFRPEPPVEPYKFLDAFEIQDHPIFFGREDASDQLFAKVTAHRLTILHAKSGAGKSSLLQAGLGPRLVRSGRLPVYTRAYEDPVIAVKRAIASPAQGPWPALLSKLTLHEFLGMAAKHLNTMQDLVIMLDQFEAFFVLGPTGEHRRPFIDDVANCIEDTSLPVRFVIALRKDYYADLSAFQVRLPQIFHHEMALSAMTQAEAEAAIIRPVAKLGRSVTYEPSLLDMLLSDLTRGEVELPHLQIICAQLYEGLASGETMISLADYEALDWAAGVLGGYLRQVLRQFKEDERKLAQAVLVALMSSEGTKKVLHYETLAEQVMADHSTVQTLLAQLVDGRLVQRDEVEGAFVYEIAHEYLVPEIQHWLDQETLEAKRIDELFTREVANWRTHRTPIPEERLTLLYPYRTSLPLHTEDATQCLVYSVVLTGYQLEDWIKLVGQPAENILLTIIREGDEQLTGKAAEGLGILWRLNEVKHLSNLDAGVRQWAVEALGTLGDIRAVEPLIAYLIDANANVRRRAAKALGKLGDVRAVEPLIALLNDVDADVRRRAAEALGKLGDLAVERVIDSLNDVDVNLRRRAAEALAIFGDTRAVEPLIVCLCDSNSGLQKYAAEALGKFGDPAVKPLIACLDNTDERVRKWAAVALGALGDERAVEPLIICLRDSNSDVQRCAAEALGKFGDPAVKPLIACLDNTDERVRKWAAVALGALGDERAVTLIIARLKDVDLDVRRRSLEALGSLGDARAVDPLIACLSHTDRSMRSIATNVLGRLGNSAVEPLISRLDKAPEDVRRRAATALGNLGDARAVKPLIAQLSDSSAGVRRAVAKALGKLKDARAVKPLVAQLSDSNPAVQKGVANALRMIGTPEALAAVKKHKANY